MDFGEVRSEEPSRLSPSLRARAIHGGAIRILGYLAGVLISLGAASILVRHLGIVGFGRYVTAMSVVALVGGVTEAGIIVYGIREFTARRDPERRRLMADLLGMRLALTAVGIGFAGCFGVIAGYDGVLIAGILVAGVGLLIQVLIDVLSIPLQAELRLARLASVDLTRRSVALLLIGVLSALGASLVPLLGASAISGLCGVALLLVMVNRYVSVSNVWNARRWSALLREVLPFALSISVGAIYFYVTIILMSVIASPHQTGYFATSFRVVQVALALPAIALTAIFPLLTRQGHEANADFANSMDRVFDVAIIFGVWMSIVLALGASIVIDVIAGPRGHPAISVLQIQGIVLSASFLSASSMFGLLALHRYRAMLIATSAALGINILLGLALVPNLGAKGGAIADVVTEIGVALGLIVALSRVLPGERRIKVPVVPWVTLAAAIALTTLLLPVPAVARVAGATVLYFGLLLTVGRIPADVIAAARRLTGLRAPA